VILVGTMQVLIALTALVTILAVLTCVLAAMVLAGFDLGSLTSIAITILCGFAVDYVVHLAHAFEQSPASRREAKCHDAFDAIGVSVPRRGGRRHAGKPHAAW
jgi:protein dispatched 1